MARLALAATLVVGTFAVALVLTPTAHGEIAAAAAEQPVANEEALLADRLEALLPDLRREALADGIRATTFDRAVQGLTPDGSIMDLLTRQPEHVLAPWDYMSRLVSAKRIADGQEMIAAHRVTLDEIEARIGVERHVVVAIWGVESSYGTITGSRYVIRSLATLTVADPRRPAFWRKELLAALKILDQGDVAAKDMNGSWAGAMGHTQFMPTSYMTNAVDHDGDGRRDIWRSVPDALASTANYLKRAGWTGGEPWGIEVVLPAGFDYAHADPGQVRTAADWQALGVDLPFGRDWPVDLKGGAMLLPAGMHGPAFLVTDNFKAILRYNNATAYALAVGHLADRLAGRPELAAPWPVDDPPLARTERRELQERLTAAGLNVGPIDGVIGGTTRGAVRIWQRRSGLPEDGWTGQRLLGLLRAGGPRP